MIIAVSQLKGLLGLSFDSDGSFFTVLKNVAQNIHLTKTPDVCLSATCIFVLLVLRVRTFSFHFPFGYASCGLLNLMNGYLFAQKIKDLKLDSMKENQTKHRICKKSLWLLSTARNAIVVLLCSVFAYLYTDSTGKSIVGLTGKQYCQRLVLEVLSLRCMTEVRVSGIQRNLGRSAMIYLHDEARVPYPR